MYCPKCGKEAATDSAFCPNCGARFVEAPRVRKTRLSMVAGILEIIDGGLKLLGVFGLTIAMIAVATDPYRGYDEVDPLYILLAVTIPLAAAAVLAIIGGMYALRGRSWGMALVGAIAASLPFSLLGIAALVLTALSREEFSQH